jgi:hypothetical protein
MNVEGSNRVLIGLRKIMKVYTSIIYATPQIRADIIPEVSPHISSHYTQVKLYLDRYK